MGHRKRPTRIIHLDEFRRDLEAAHGLVIKHLREVRPSSPHYDAILPAAVAIIEALRIVSVQPPSWASNTKAPRQTSNG